MKTITTLSILASLYILDGCTSQGDRDNQLHDIRSRLTASAYYPEESFTIVDAPKQIDGLQMGMAIVKRERDGAFFSVLVTPDKKLAEGMRVELVEVSYKYTYITPKEFLVVR